MHPCAYTCEKTKFNQDFIGPSWLQKSENMDFFFISMQMILHSTFQLILSKTTTVSKFQTKYQ